jgi:hypothetical protein
LTFFARPLLFVWLLSFCGMSNFISLGFRRNIVFLT